MNINELTREEQERLGSWKSSITYYLYLLKYRHFKDGILAFNTFQRNAANYAAQLGANKTLQVEILSVQDFIALERLFWELMEQLFAKNKDWRPKTSFDPGRKIESIGSLRDWYIAYNAEHLVGRRFFWQYTFNEMRGRTISDIYESAKSINKINGVLKIPMSFVSEQASKIANTYNFEDLELALEEVSGRIWDCIQPIADTLLNELEKADCKHNPAYPYEGYGARFPSSFDAFRREEIWGLAWLLEGLADNGNESAIKYLQSVGHPNFPMPAENKKAQVKAKTKQTTRENDVLDFYDR